MSTEGEDSRPAAAEAQVDDPAWLRSLEECSIVQVINSDESGHVYKPVVGGYKFTRIGDEKVLVKFKLAGDYWFKLTNHPSTQNLPLLKVSVVPEEPLNLIITDEGFLPKIIRIGLLIKQYIFSFFKSLNYYHKQKLDEGSSLRWTWNRLSHPHSIYEAEYCDGHIGIFQSSKE